MRVGIRSIGRLGANSGWPSAQAARRWIVAVLVLLFGMAFAAQAHAATCTRSFTVDQDGGRQLVFLASNGGTGCGFTVPTVQLMVNDVSVGAADYTIDYASGAKFEKLTIGGTVGYYYTPAATYVASHNVIIDRNSPTINTNGDSVYIRSAAPSTSDLAVVININPAAAPAPAVTAISPTSGPAAGGTSVTITGTDFTGATAVTFGGTAATGFTVNSATQITATSPAGSGTVDIRVTTTGGTSATSAADQFTYIAAPTVTSVSPTAGPTAGGTTVTITGTGFSGATAVTFGGTAATGFTVNSATQITATSPAGSGTVDIRVTTPGGTSATSAADQFTYIAAPTVTSVSPTAGPTAGGTTVTITGTGFSGATAVTFGGTAATGFTVNSATQITATSPAGSGTVDIRVTTTGGTSATSAADQFTYVPPPVLTGFTSAAVGYNSTGNAIDAAAGSSATNSPTGWQVANSAGGPFAASATSQQGTTTNVSIDASGQVTYAAPTGFRGNDTFFLRASNAAGTSNVVAVTVPVSNPVLSATLAGSGTRGTALAGVQVNGSGGQAPYSCTLASGALPVGTTLNADCTITGTPGAAGSFNFVVGLTDSSTGTGPFAQNSGSLTLTVAASNQTITFAGPGAQSRAASPVALSATATSGLTVTFSSTTPAVCTVAGSSATLLATGTCTIDADQAGDVNWNAAPTVTRSFQVLDPLVVTPGAPSGTAVGAAYSQANPASGGVAPYIYALASGALPAGTTLNTATGEVIGTPTVAGAFNYAIRASDSQGAPFTATGSTVSGTIAQAAQTISFTSVAPAPATAGGATYTVTATATSGLTVAFALDGASSGCALAGNVVSFTGAGTCRIDANQPGDANVAAAPQVQQAITVTAANISVTPGAPSGTSVGAAYSQANPASGGLAPYVYVLASGALPAGTSLNAGTGQVSGTPTTAGAFSYAIRATDSQNPAVSATGATVSGTIAQAGQTISFTSAAPAGATAGGATYTATATATSGLAVTFTLDGASSGCALAGNVVSFTGAGTCRIDANQAGDANVGAAPQVQQSFAVAAAGLSIVPAAPSGTSVNAVYSQANSVSGGLAPYAYALASGALPAGTSLNAGTGQVSGTPTTAGAFSYAIRATDSQNPAVSATGTTVSGTISQAGQTINFTSTPPTSPVAGGPTYIVAATASSGLPVAFTLDGASTGCSLSGSVISFTGAGTCRIDANQPGDTNVAAAPQVQQALTVTAASISVTPGAPSGTSVGGSYSQANPASGGVAPYAYVLASGALPAGTSLDAGTGQVSGTPTTAGAFSYAIRATDSQNPAVSATGATVSGTIAQAGQTISFTSTPPASPLVGGPAYTVTATATSGLPVSFTLDAASTGCSLAGSAVSFTGVGTCRIDADQPGDANTAAAPQVQQSFAVGKGDQTIAFTPLPDVSQTAPPIALGATASSGLPVAFATTTTAVCTVSGATLTLVGSGTCTVTADQAGDTDWNPAPTVSRSFAVSPPPAVLVVTLTHTGNAVQGGNLDYVATPGTSGGPTAGTLTAAFTLPAGMSYVGATGTGWSCSGSGGAATCTSTIAIPAGGSGAAITLTAAFAADAGSPLAPSVTLSGGGAAASASASDSTVVQAPPPVAGPLAATVPYQTATAIDLAPGLSGGPRTSVSATQGAHGATAISGDVVTYTPTAGYSGADSFTYTATGPGGTSAPGIVTVTVSPPPVPTAPAREVTVLAGRPITIDLTAGASGGPFTAAAVLSTSPVDSGDVRLVESGPAGNRSYSLEFTSRGTFAGAAAIGYTISNAGGTSQPLLLTVNVTARPNPALDPEVRGIESAETGAVRRFASSQIRNFARRLEQLHGEGGGGNSFGVSIAPGIPMPMVDRRNPLAANDPTAPGRTDGRGGNVAGALGRYAALSSLASGQAGEDGSTAAVDEGATAAAADGSGGGGGRAVGGIALWANGTIAVGRRDPATGREKLTMSTSGITGGADIRVAPWATVGIGVGFGHDSTDVGDNGSKLSTGSWSIGAYGSFRPVDGAFVDVLAGFGGFDLDIDRFVTATGTMATGQRDANLLFGSITAGIDREAQRLRWSLYGGLEASRARLGSYAEVGPIGYSLVYDKRRLESLSGLLGGRFRVEVVEGDLVLIPRGRFEYRYDFERAAGQRVRFGDWLSGPSYLIDADGWSRSTFSSELGLGLRTRSGWQFGSDVIGNLSGSSRSIGLRIEVSKEF